MTPCTCDLTSACHCPMHMETISRKKIVYISGPMRGHPQLNFPVFFQAQQALEDMGFATINPAHEDIALGLDPNDYRPPSKEELELIVRRDVEAVFRCDALLTLPGWRTSIGARAEHALAEFLQKEIMPFIPQRNAQTRIAGPPSKFYLDAVPQNMLK